MIDTLEANRKRAKKMSIEKILQANLYPRQSEFPWNISNYFPVYGVMTLHRPSNVDCPETFVSIFDFLMDEASVLVGNDVIRIRDGYRKTLAGERSPVLPQLWDGQTAPRCLQAVLTYV